ncbi:MAG: hypothetical protein RB191_05615, partial [Terriglobia bacterium]|nr:hypothetical protein [Terriglobia bacterium]
GFMYFMGEGVLPVFEGLVPKARADSLVRSLYDMGAFATGWGLPAFLLVLALMITLVIWSLPRWTGSLRILAEKIFPWSFYRDMQGYLWLMGYSSLLGAGTPEIGALGTQLTAATPWLAEKLRAISYHMKGGLKLPAALRQATPGDTEEGSAPRASSAIHFHFPSLEIIEDIESLHGFADFPDRIERVADQWSEDIMERTQLVAKVLGLIGSLLTYAVIIFIILGCNDLQASLSATASVVSH